MVIGNGGVRADNSCPCINFQQAVVGEVEDALVSRQLVAQALNGGRFSAADAGVNKDVFACLCEFDKVLLFR